MTFFHSPSFPSPESREGSILNRKINCMLLSVHNFVTISLRSPEREKPQIATSKAFRGKAGWKLERDNLLDRILLNYKVAVNKCHKVTKFVTPPLRLNLPDAAGCCETGVNWCQCMPKAPLGRHRTLSCRLTFRARTKRSYAGCKVGPLNGLERLRILTARYVTTELEGLHPCNTLLAETMPCMFTLSEPGRKERLRSELPRMLAKGSQSYRLAMPSCLMFWRQSHVKQGSKLNG